MQPAPAFCASIKGKESPDCLNLTTQTLWRLTVFVQSAIMGVLNVKKFEALEMHHFKETPHKVASILSNSVSETIGKVWLFQIQLIFTFSNPDISKCLIRQNKFVKTLVQFSIFQLFFSTYPLISTLLYLKLL